MTVEDHWPEGGIGDAVLEALAEVQPHPIVVKLAVRDMPGSGKPAELLRAAGIDAEHIADAARDLVSRTGRHDETPPRSAPVGASREMGEAEMTGAEQDRQRDKAVDQDGKAAEVAERADATNTLQRLHAAQDQSPWIDFIDRELIESGRLAEMVGDGIRGLTSNPTIFAKAVATGQYDDLVKS